MLPVFALANAGVSVSAEVVRGHGPLMTAIALGVFVGKPPGLVLGCALAAWSGIAVKPDAYTWRQLAGAGALAGIGFTMSLFIAGQAFPPASVRESLRSSTAFPKRSRLVCRERASD